MAKTGLFGGGAAAPAAAVPQGGFMGRIFGGGAPAGGGGGGGLFPNLSADDRFKMIEGMLSNAQQGAQGAENPLLSFLMPVVSSVVGARAAQQRDTARAEEVSRMTETLIGPSGLPAQAKTALGVMNNPAAPDYLRDIATSMFKGSVPIDTPTGGNAPRRSAAPVGPKTARLTYISRDPDGVYRGYNPASGKREPVPNADAPAANASPPPFDPNDPLGILSQPAATFDPNDPLGIL